MSIPLIPDFRIVSGHVPLETLLADDSSRIRYWSNNPRKLLVVGWEMVSLFTSVREGLNGAGKGNGLPNWRWFLSEAHDELLDALRAEIFPGGILTNLEVTAYTVAKGWAGGTVMKCFHASVSWSSLFRPELTPISGGRFSNLGLQFFNALPVAPVEEE